MSQPSSRTAVCDDGVEHRLHVGRRLADDAQDVGGRGLPRQRFLGLVEQPHVLDRDHGLVGEGFSERNFAVSEHCRMFADQCQQPDAFLVSQQRHEQRAINAVGPRRRFSRSGSSMTVQSG